MYPERAIPNSKRKTNWLVLIFFLTAARTTSPSAIREQNRTYNVPYAVLFDTMRKTLFDLDLVAVVADVELGTMDAYGRTLTTKAMKVVEIVFLRTDHITKVKAKIRGSIDDYERFWETFEKNLMMGDVTFFVAASSFLAGHRVTHPKKLM